MVLNNISALCKEKGVSIAKLEKECAVGNGTIRGWNTSNPRIDTLKKVADYLNVPIEKLLK